MRIIDQSATDLNRWKAQGMIYWHVLFNFIMHKMTWYYVSWSTITSATVIVLRLYSITTLCHWQRKNWLSVMPFRAVTGWQGFHDNHDSSQLWKGLLGSKWNRKWIEDQLGYSAGMSSIGSPGGLWWIWGIETFLCFELTTQWHIPCRSLQMLLYQTEESISGLRHFVLVFGGMESFKCDSSQIWMNVNVLGLQKCCIMMQSRLYCGVFKAWHPGRCISVCQVHETVVKLLDVEQQEAFLTLNCVRNGVGFYQRSHFVAAQFITWV